MVLSVGQLDRSYQRDNLSVHPQCDIQKPLRINTQPQLQSSESHHTLALPTQAPHHLRDTHLQTYVFLEIFCPAREDVCQHVPIFKPSRLGFNHSNNISRYFD